MIKKKKILICPLDWGLGHATRCVPVIKKLLDFDLEVMIAADERPLAFLEKEFPDLDFIKFEGLKIRYPSKSNMTAKLLFMYPDYIKSIKRDNEKLQDYLDKYKFDAVISDNRFGCYNSGVLSIYITHQLMIKAPSSIKFTEPFLHRLHKKIINKYNFCWIPDFKDSESISGDLANKYPIDDNYSFIGPLSRFRNANKKSNKENIYKILAILSGPEPQRSILEDKLINEFLDLPFKTAIVSGKTEIENESYQLKNLTVFNNLRSDHLLNTLLSSEIVISRSGYSSIMDMVSVGKNAIFIPTPGQTEQEYLAKYHKSKGNFYYEKQSHFDLKRAMKESEKFIPNQVNNNNDLLDKAIKNLIKIIS